MRKTYKLIILVGLFIALFVSAIPNLSKAVSNSILEINKPIESVVSTDNNSGNLEVNKPSSEENTLEVNKSTEGENKEDNKAAENIVADVTPNTATPGLLIDGRTPEEFFKPYEDILGTSDISYGELVTGNYVKSLNVTDEQLEELEINGIRTFTKKKLNLFRSVASFMGFRSVGTSPDPDADWPEITLDGNVAYCLNFEKKAPKDVNYTQSDNITYQNIGIYSKEQISLVAYYGYPSNATGLKEKYSLSDSDARINTQRAIWIMTGSPSNQVAPNKSPYANEIMDLAKASKYPWTEGTISDNNLNFTDQGGYYESQDITINGGPGTYTVNVQNGTAVNTNGDPLGSVNTGTAFRVRADKNFDGTVSADVTVSYTAKTLSFWVPDNDAYQNLIRVHDDPRRSVLKATGYIAPVPKFSQITVKKVDGNTQNPLQGATIGLYKDGAEVKQEVTNDQGIIVFDNLQLGNYIVKEIAAPTGYVLDGSDNPVDATTEGNKDITLNNTKIKGNIRLLKKRADNNSPLAGAVFALSQGGQELKRETTNAQGIVEFNDLEYGDYQVTEITPPTGFNLDPTPMDVQIRDHGKTYDLEMVNSSVIGHIELVKRSNDNKVLQGAVFGLYKNGQEVKRDTTNDQGIIRFENLEFGEYDLIEITPPTGYNLDATPKRVNIDTNGKTYNIEAINEIIKGNIKLAKKDQSGNLLQGAEFGIFQGNKELERKTTDTAGVVLFENLTYGAYEIKELKAPTGFNLDPTPIPVTIDTNGKTYNVEMTNGSIKGNIEVVKKSNDNKVLQGAVFGVFKNGQEIHRGTTNSQGIIRFEDLEYGDYDVKEITPPTGYNLNPNPTHVTIDTNGKTYQVEVINETIKGNIKLIKKDKDGNLLSGAVFGLFQGDRKLKQQTTDNQGVVLFENITFGNYQIKEITPPTGYNLNPNTIQVNVDTNGKTYTVEMINEIIKGHIEVLKVDEEDPTNVLKGAVFGLFKGDVKIKEVTTGDNGIARFENLVFGNYQVKELKSPVGFLLNTKVFDVNVDTQGKTYNVTVNDAPIKAPVEITKIDKMTNMFISGVKFELRQNGKVLETLTTNDRGYVKSKDYRYGDYELVEIEAPPMYELDPTPIPVEIRGDKASIKLTIPNTPKVTLVTINKTSEHNEPIEGVRYLISNNTTNQEVVTDKAGKASITLLYGDYTVKELSAPRKFVVDSSPKTLMVRGEKETELNYINNIKKGSVKVIKMDDINKQFLEGVTFDIFKDDNTKVGSIVTGKDGSATSELLEYGSYYLKEKAPLKDYLPNETQYKFDILENEQVVTINVYNSPKLGKIELHKTDAENGQGIEGIQFGVFDSNNKQIDTLTTDVNGVAYSRDLRMGKYTVKELGTKPEYLLNTKVFDVTLTDHKEVVKVDVTNIPVKGYVDLYKVDFDENNKPIEGAEFTLFADKECTKPLETLVTDAKGYSKSKAYRYGKYYLKETKVSKEYWMDESVREVNITENDKTYTFNITNEIRKSIISILKRDEVTGELLKGVTFKVSCLTNTDFEPIKISTNGDGIARTDLLDYGTYRIEEVDAPIQYLLAEPVDVVIDGNQASIGKPLEPDVVQVPIFNKKKLGKLALTKSLSQPKINTTGDNALAETKPLKDIEFTLFKAVLVDNPTNENLFFRMINKITNKEKITEWEQLAVFFTDDAGKINADSLEYGDYKLEETLPIEMQETEDYLFSVKEDGYVENANILNTYKNGIFEMYKTDNEGNPIEGVVFDILNNTKEHIKTCVTDKNGRFDIELPLGDYYYKEISVPNVEKGHYIFSDSEVPFSITPDATVIRAEVVNELVKEPETPETLAMKSNMGIDLSLGVAGTSISSILLVFYMRKRR